ncbi:zinc ribbon domain-containing protein, partial [Sphaerochaeta sp. S2]|uniref:zinc ribbon domain-containing protein n=2 Tax=unclassified Sphaerochaeta TaxID=2637943 RepID=UPI001E3B18E7
YHTIANAQTVSQEGFCHFLVGENHDMLKFMEKKRYVCPKCGGTHYESDRFQATGGNFAKIFDVQNKRFITVTCTNCGYTELFKQNEQTGWNILDFFLN